MIRTPKTAKRVPVWSVVLVGMSDEMATLCEGMLSPLVIVRVADTVQALDKLAQVRPLLTVVIDDSKIDQVSLRERAKDVCSEFLAVPAKCNAIDLERMLKRSLAIAESKLT